MYLNERGFSVYTVLSIILFLALVFILALPHFFNLDKGQNEENCINNMKLIWVATTEYMKDHMASFDGDLKTLLNTPKKVAPAAEGERAIKSKGNYLDKAFKCPEGGADADKYIIFGKLVVENIEGTQKLNYGAIVICPNLAHHPKHFIPKSFYENMEPTELQNFFIDDLDVINTTTGADGNRKLELVKKYIEIWKSDPTALARMRENPLAVRNQVLPPAQAETAEPVTE